jgi:serine/threonine protein kinase
MSDALKGHAAWLNRRVGGSYRVLDLVGEGASSWVFRAEDEDGKHVALKIGRHHQRGDAVAIARFHREAHAVRRLKHPACVRVLDSGEDDGDAFIVMELCGGEDLQELIRREGRLSQVGAVQIAITLCDVLIEAHGLGVVHRDLKARNIKVLRRKDDELQIKVLDFGLARLVRTEEESTFPDTLTEPGMMLGTPHYMAPEQVTHNEVDGRADIYAIGVLLYQMITGRLPLVANTPLETIVKVARERPRSPSQLRVLIDEELERIVMRCLEKSPAARWPTAKELKSALAATLDRLHALEALRAVHRNESERDEETETKTAPTKRFGRRRPARPVHEEATADDPTLLRRQPSAEPAEEGGTLVIRNARGVADDSTEVMEDPGAADAPPRRQKRLIVAVALLVAAVILLVVGWWNR